MTDNVIEWNCENVRSFIVGCLEDHGLPMFKTRRSRKEITYNGKPAVMAICYGGFGKQEDSVLFVNVPEYDLNLIKEHIGDWKYLLLEYGTPEDIKKYKSMIQPKKLILEFP